jgi:hypothetical protein
MNRSLFVRDALRRDAALRQWQMRARPSAPPRVMPPPRGPRARPQRGRTAWNWFGADAEFGADDGSQLMLFGMLPMAIAVGAGLWMALH